MDPTRTTPETDIPTLLYRRDKNAFDGLEDMPLTPGQPLPSAGLGTSTQPIQRDPSPRAPISDTPPAKGEPLPDAPLGTVTQPIPLDNRPHQPVPAMPPTPAEVKANETVAAPPCPRCGSKLLNPDSLGWCPKCGFCRSLDQDGAKMTLTATPAYKPSPLGAVEFLEMLNKLPKWLWVLLGGLVALTIFSLAGDFFLPKKSLPRALWSSLQLALGLVTLIAAQAWALILIAPNDDRLGPKDIILSGRLWGLVFRRLPDTRRQLWLGAWGLSAMICAVLLVGGFDYWYQFYTPKKYAEKNLLAAAMALAKGKDANKTMTEALEDFANKAQDLTKQDEKDDRKDNRPTVQCLVIGYKIGEKKQLDGLVLAEERDGKFRYVGVVQKGFTPELTKELLGRLAPLVRPDPIIRELNIPAIWVNPGVFCEVHQSGYDEQGHLKGPRFGNLLEVEK